MSSGRDGRMPRRRPARWPGALHREDRGAATASVCTAVEKGSGPLGVARLRRRSRFPPCEAPIRTVAHPAPRGLEGHPVRCLGRAVGSALWEAASRRDAASQVVGSPVADYPAVEVLAVEVLAASRRDAASQAVEEAAGAGSHWGRADTRDSVAVGSPAAGSPAAGSPAVGSPAVGSPAAGSPAVGSPAAGSPAAGSPAAGSPAAGSPAAGSQPDRSLLLAPVL